MKRLSDLNSNAIHTAEGIIDGDNCLTWLISLVVERSVEVSDDCFQNMECLAGSYEVELFESRVKFRC